MASLPPPVEPTPPTPAAPSGGPGWGIRQSSPAPLRDWDAAAAAPPPMSPPAGNVAPPAPNALPRFAAPAAAPPSAPRRGLALIGVVAAVAAIAVVGVAVMASHQAPTAATDAAAVATQVPTAAPKATATPAPTPVSAAAIQAGHEYLAVSAPLNAAESRFAVTYNAAMHSSCNCPSGQFDASGALKQLPAVLDAITAMQTTLQHIKLELPAQYADIDAVVSDNQSVSEAYGHAIYAYQHNDPAGITDDINYASTDNQKAAPDFARLRADLGLPPPPA